MNADREELLTVEQVAQYLKVIQQTVRNWIDRNILRATRIGQRRVRIRQSELDRFIAAGESNNGDDAAPIDPELSSALAAAADAKDTTELAAALRAVAAAAERLADALGP
jgi:excisionase family DNA binding protein